MSHRDLLMCIALLVSSGLQQSISATRDTRCNGSPSTDWSCCAHDAPCYEGGGDCDRDSDCIGSLKCGNNNCRNEFSSDGSNWSSAADCCFGMYTILYVLNTCSRKMPQIWNPNEGFDHIVTSDIAEDCKGSPSTDWNCCSDAFPCMLGGGDCDDDSQCAGNLVCGSDNCQRDFSSSNSHWMTGADCCRGNLLYLDINHPVTDCI